jgi:LysM repeat protein
MGVLSAAIVLGSVGCGGDVRNDPFIVEKFKELDGQIAKSKDLPAKVQDLNEDVVSLRDEIARLKGMGGATSTPIAMAAQLRTISQRLQEMEVRVQGLEAAVKAKPPAAGAPKATPAPTPAPTPASKAPAATPAPAIPPKATPLALRTIPIAAPTTKTASTAKVGGAPKVGVPKAAGSKAAEASGSRGEYYTAVEGDTVKSVAARFKVSVEDLCNANTFLRSDSVLVPGDRCWVPPYPKK